MIDLKRTTETFLQSEHLFKVGYEAVNEDLKALRSGECPDGITESDLNEMRRAITDLNSDFSLSSIEHNANGVSALLDQLSCYDPKLFTPEESNLISEAKADPEEFSTNGDFDSLIKLAETMNRDAAEIIVENLNDDFINIISEDRKYYFSPEAKMTDDLRLAISCATYRDAKRCNSPVADPYTSALFANATENILHYEALGAAAKMTIEDVEAKIKEIAYKFMCFVNKAIAGVLTGLAAYGALEILTIIMAAMSFPEVLAIIVLLLTGVALIENAPDSYEEFVYIGEKIEDGVAFAGKEIGKFFMKIKEFFSHKAGANPPPPPSFDFVPDPLGENA